MLMDALRSAVGRRVPLARSVAVNMRDMATVRRVVRENRLRPLTWRELDTLRDDAVERLGSSVHLGTLAL
jgi:hypothetical protein